VPHLTAVLLETHMVGPLRAAAAAGGVDLDVHLIQSLDPAAFRRSLERTDAVFGGVLTLEEGVRRLVAIMTQVRPAISVFFHSQAEALALTRIGNFDAAGPEWRAVLPVLKAAGAPLPGILNVVLAAIPQLDRILPPGQFDGLKAYAQASRLWSDGTVESLTALMRFLLGEQITPPQPVPQVALWHPRGGCFTDLASYQAWYETDLSAASDASAPSSLPLSVRPTVGVLLHRRWVASGNAGHFAAVIEQLEALGLAAYPAFSDLDATPMIDRFFEPVGVECLLNLVSFNLIGGHGRPDPARAAALLERFDRPYLCAVPLVLQSLDEWRASRLGLAPHQSVMQVAMPELEGGAEPWVYAGRGQDDAVEADPEQAKRLAQRVRNWVDLRRTPRSERRIAITLFSMPPDKGSVGSAAYLDVFESIYRLMTRLKSEGYEVDLPASTDQLRRDVLGTDVALPGAESIAVAGRMTATEYKKQVPHWARIARCWGPPPGLIDSDGQSVAIRGKAFGNLLVGVQPGFGYEGDPMRLLFHPDASPTHAFAAYYAWVEKVWGAHALLHFGTHGALEFMPGRQVGLGSDDFSAALIGELPHLYFYSLNNPSEASIAKRRGGGVVISHLTPPLSQAGLYRTLLALRDAVRSCQAHPTAPALEAVVELAEAAQLDAEVPPGEGYIDRLSTYLLELETRLIPIGLHIAGQTDGMEETARAAATMRGVSDTDPVVQDLIDRASRSDEIGALVRALDGRYVAPAPGGDPARNPEVLPSGRNIHALNPWSVPSLVAARSARAQVEELLARMGKIPESVAVVLWGSDNIKTQGESVAQALWLMGAVAQADSLGRMSRVKLIPLAELGRPRIDVVITCSGIFRDLFPSVMEMLERAAHTAATADEPLELNYVRKRALAISAELRLPIDVTSRRVFAARPGNYGTGVNHMVQESAWESTADLGKVYIERMSWSYAGESATDVERDTKLLKAALSGVETAIQQMDSTELGLSDIDHYFEHLGGIVSAVESVKGTRPDAFVFDAGVAGSKPRTLQEALRIESRTRLLNPRWYEGMLKHGYQGVHEIAQRLDHTFGWQATAGAVDGWVFSGAAEILLEQADRMRDLNPQAFLRMTGRLLEADQRKMWAATPEEIAALSELRDQIEERLEGVV